MPTSIQDVPPEILSMILSHIDPVDYLKVKLLSRTFFVWASVEFRWKDMTKAKLIQGQTNLEASLPRTRRLTHFICTHCGLVKDKHMFSDNQAVKTNPRRICISCGISRRVYTQGQMPKVDGVERIPCWHCRKAVRKYAGWEETIASGKVALAKVLEGSRARGSPKSYSTADGRRLGWSQELQALAFCQPCLGHMMSHEEVHSILGH